MVRNNPEAWDERYKENSQHFGENPSELLLKWISRLPSGRALVIACGAGRNALFLAENNYEVDAIDYSKEALSIAKERAQNKELEINWILADLSNYVFPSEAYEVITMMHYKPENNHQEIKNSLKNGGYILQEHHINTQTPMDHGPSNPEFRYDSNELLESYSDFQIFEYEEGIKLNEKREKSGICRIVARKTRNPQEKIPNLNE
ncbi:MAG: methyltransferase domain-containing protein [Hadesarchaea archaeon]|nr:methyltransferase domain-containing protein [Hadesarchaea archaeon]